MQRAFSYTITAVCLFVVAAVPPASAHLGNLSHSEIKGNGSYLSYTLKFAAHLIPGVAQESTKRLTRADVISREPGIRSWLFDSILVFGGARRCRPSIEDIIGPDTNDDLTVVLGYDCEHVPPPLRVEFHPFDRIIPDYRNIVTLALGDMRVSYVFTRDAPLLTVGDDVGIDQEHHFEKFFSLGVVHILEGYDHLLFLLAVLLLGGSIGRLCAIITAFTIAHSITLALAALGIVSLPPRPVEAMIAASIVYVAVENLVVTKADHRWLVTFGFGLVHGFGFAGVLGEAGLDAGNIVVPLLGFNLGVESGQLFVVLIVVPLLRACMRLIGERPVRIALSWVILVAGAVWLVERSAGLLL